VVICHSKNSGTAIGTTFSVEGLAFLVAAADASPLIISPAANLIRIMIGYGIAGGPSSERSKFIYPIRSVIR
jgi:hypothetical protein